MLKTIRAWKGGVEKTGGNWGGWFIPLSYAESQLPSLSLSRPTRHYQLQEGGEDKK